MVNPPLEFAPDQLQGESRELACELIPCRDMAYCDESAKRTVTGRG